MILLVHMLFGAAIGSAIVNPYLALLLALAGHYFLDFFPHIEYSIDAIRSKRWKESFFDAAKVAMDFLFGILLILLFSKNNALIYFCSFAAIVPDGLTVVSSMFPEFLARHHQIHTQKIHYFKYKKIPKAWRIATQLTAMFISIIVLVS